MSIIKYELISRSGRDIVVSLKLERDGTLRDIRCLCCLDALMWRRACLRLSAGKRSLDQIFQKFDFVSLPVGLSVIAVDEKP